MIRISVCMYNHTEQNMINDISKTILKTEPKQNRSILHLWQYSSITKNRNHRRNEQTRLNYYKYYWEKVQDSHAELKTWKVYN